MKAPMIAAAAALTCFACGGSGNGSCEGSCASGSTRCLGNAVQTCIDPGDGGCPE